MFVRIERVDEDEITLSVHSSTGKQILELFARDRSRSIQVATGSKRELDLSVFVSDEFKERVHWITPKIQS